MVDADRAVRPILVMAAFLDILSFSLVMVLFFFIL
jgi:hypothetical protein